MYLSETGWTLPDISAVNDVFARKYDQSVYEKKIAALVREIQATGGVEGREQSDPWTEAVRMLRKEDHYLLVMVDQAGSRRLSAGRLVKLGILTIIGCCVVLVVLVLTTRS